MFTKKSQIITIVMFVCLVCLGVAGYADNYNDGSTVDQIYQKIRYAEAAYRYTENIVSFRNEGMTIIATLVIPESYKKCPIIITLNGFTGDRNDYGYPVAESNGETMWTRLSRILAQQGIASLRIDFRGSGDSEGDFSITSFSSQISDTRAAIEYICNNLKHQVDIKNIGVLGYSQGGLIGTTAAANDKKQRVKSLVLWAAPAFPCHDYEGLITKDGMKRGLSLADGETFDFYGFPLKRQFFEEIFKYDPLAEARKYTGPMLYVSATQDAIVWPQPTIGQSFLKYHDGFEKLVSVKGGHNFDLNVDKENFDDVVYWSTAWFLKTLR